MYALQNSQFHFPYRVISDKVLVKTRKPQLCYCPDGVMVKLCVYQAQSTLCATVRIPVGSLFLFEVVIGKDRHYVDAWTKDSPYVDAWTIQCSQSTTCSYYAHSLKSTDLPPY